MQLHLARNACVVALAEVNARPSFLRRPHLVGDGIAARTVENRRVGDTVHADVVFNFVLFALDNPFRNFARGKLNPDVRRAFHTAVPFPVTVCPPVRINSPPAYAERLRKAVVKAHIMLPVCRNLERLNYVRVPPVEIMGRIVLEFREYLSFERIPTALQKRVAQRFRLLFQLENIVFRDERVFRRQRRNVLRSNLFGLVQRFGKHFLRHDLHVRPSVHELFLYPAVTDVSRVRRGTDNRDDAQRFLRALSRFQKVVHNLLKRGQLVEVHELHFQTGVREPVRRPLAVSEQNLASVYQREFVSARVVLCKLFRIARQRFLNVRVFQLTERPPENAGRRVRPCQRSKQRVHHQCLRLPATGGASVQYLVGFRRMERGLLWGRLIIDRNQSSLASLLFFAVRLFWIGRANRGHAFKLDYNRIILFPENYRRRAVQHLARGVLRQPAVRVVNLIHDLLHRIAVLRERSVFYNVAVHFAVTRHVPRLFDFLVSAVPRRSVAFAFRYAEHGQHDFGHRAPFRFQSANLRLPCIQSIFIHAFFSFQKNLIRRGCCAGVPRYYIYISTRITLPDLGIIPPGSAAPPIPPVPGVGQGGARD